MPTSFSVWSLGKHLMLAPPPLPLLSPPHLWQRKLAPQNLLTHNLLGLCTM